MEAEDGNRMHDITLVKLEQKSIEPTPAADGPSVVRLFAGIVLPLQTSGRFGTWGLRACRPMEREGLWLDPSKDQSADGRTAVAGGRHPGAWGGRARMKPMQPNPGHWKVRFHCATWLEGS